MSSINHLDHTTHQLPTSMSPSDLSPTSDHHQGNYGLPSPQGYHQANPYAPFTAPPVPMALSPISNRKRPHSDDSGIASMQIPLTSEAPDAPLYGKQESPMMRQFSLDSAMRATAAQQAHLHQPQMGGPSTKRSRVNTPWTPIEEKMLKQLRDMGQSWSEIAKSFPNRTEGSVKKHWYKDMHYADFVEDEGTALLHAIRDYESSKWKVIGQKVGKPAKACEQYAREHFTREQMAGKAKDKDLPLEKPHETEGS